MAGSLTSSELTKLICLGAVQKNNFPVSLTNQIILSTNFNIYKIRGGIHRPIIKRYREFLNNYLQNTVGRFFRINKSAPKLNCHHNYNCILPMSAEKNKTADFVQESQDQTTILCHNGK